jgi:urocanate hydratase
LARQHFGGSLRGRVVLTAGLGGMGGAQPLAVTMNDGVAVVIEVDEARARRRQEIGYVDRLTSSVDSMPNGIEILRSHPTRIGKLTGRLSLPKEPVGLSA